MKATYTEGMAYSLDDFVPFDTEANGAVSVSNDLEAMIRVDYEGEGAVGGIFTQKTGSAEIIWPGTEHAIVIEGQVSITYHATGETVDYGPGDGWTIQKDERVTWSVTSPRFAKSFFTMTGE